MSHHQTTRPRVAAVLLSGVLLPAVLVLSACSSATTSGSSSSASGSAASTAATPAGGYPVTVTLGKSSVSLKAKPTHIVSLSPTATEMLYAIGAGSQVTAVDSDSNYPATAPKTKLSGFQPNAEAVAGYQPDLVVISNDVNGLMASLTKLGIPTLLLPAANTLDDSYAQEASLGQATDHVAQAAKVAAETKARIAAAIATVPASARKLSYYHELDQTYYSVTSTTFLGGIYKLFGLTDIADTSPKAAAAGGYPQLSAEFIVKSAPDVIVLADGLCCGQSLAAVGARKGWATIPAVKNAKVVMINDDIASRWGPRTADFAEAVAKILAA
jgi:iron complex transport system substrate-binding protein